MIHIRSIIRKGLLVLAVTVVSAAPLGTLATVSADVSNPQINGDCSVPADSSYGPGVHSPSGAEAQAFTYQCPGETDNQYASDWLSARYVYYPKTNDKEPIVPVVYTFNCATNKYDYVQYDYAVTSNSYIKDSGSTSTPPSNTKVVGGPGSDYCPATNATTSGTGSGSATARTTAATAAPSAGQSVGTSGSNTINANGNNSATLNNNSGVSVTNTIGSNANSGNAVVLGNTSGGDATSGDTMTEADVINMLQSSSNAIGSGTNVATFTYNIDGDVTGDLLFDPSQIQNVQGDTTVDKNLNNNLVINNSSNATINNNLTLGSTSGDATVSNNTSGGNATSGNATTVANVVNSITSAIVAGKSFIGTININGNLNGDILLPANFVDTLLADNVPTVAVTAPSSQNSINTTSNNKATVTNTNNQGISNTVNSNAASGNANVSNNTAAGTASSGSATTHVTAFNLTGSKVIANNDILVFVNVLGKWTGLIVNAPAGATAAELGGNVTENSTTNNNATLNNTTSQQINNNVNVNANSGNANVTSNTQGGNAKTGNAQTAVNLANVENSTLDLSNWFGILFINVFGTWNGSFGVNTSAGDTAAAVANGGSATYLVAKPATLVHYAAPAVKNTTSSANVPATQTTTSTVPSSNISDGTVLAASTKSPSKNPTPQLQNDAHSSLVLPAVGLVIGLGILGSERLFSRRRS